MRFLVLVYIASVMFMSGVWAEDLGKTTPLVQPSSLEPIPHFDPWVDMDLMGKMLFLLVAFNFLLSGLGKFLDVIKNVTEGDGDNKAAAFLNRASSWLQKIIDWFSANRPHK